ncbi:MAG: polyribonucleotide nucleotidyltransferase, partial [Kiloniellales bacterium]
MFDIHRKELDWGGRRLVIETGRIARQADGAVMISYGDTMVLCTAVGQYEPRQGIDFFPLTVNYQEKTSAAGKIPGGFFKREGRPSEKEVLTSRLIDRPIRPLFAKGYKNETQVICTVLSHDLENDPDYVAMIGASAALTLSGLPFLGPIAGCRVGYWDGAYVLNPRVEDVPESELDLMVAGTHDGVLMVESQASELSEEVMLGAVMFGHEQMQPVIDAIIDLAERCAREPRDLPAEPPEYEAVKEKLESGFAQDIAAAYREADKMRRRELVDEVRARAIESLGEDEAGLALAPGILKELESKIVRGSILETGRRIDGRSTRDVRPIVSEVGVLPRTHGSALFTRGETQALVTTTLGTGQDEQIIDALDGDYRQHFMLHYNFPPYSVGEAKRMIPPGRREIGHGKLAWRALRPVMPSPESFPYTVRLVSEITESNGSSSMATVCGSALSLMDAGVPITRPVAGIAMGLINEDDGIAVLSDIL